MVAYFLNGDGVETEGAGPRVHQLHPVAVSLEGAAEPGVVFPHKEGPRLFLVFIEENQAQNAAPALGVVDAGGDLILALAVDDGQRWFDALALEIGLGLPGLDDGAGRHEPVFKGNIIPAVPASA